MEALGNETFEIDTELTRDAIKAGVWSRTCSEMADREEDAVWRPGVEPLATKRGEDATAVLAALADTDIDYLAAARRRFIAIEGPHSARRSNWTTCGGSCRVRGIRMRTAGFGRRPRFALLRMLSLLS